MQAGVHGLICKPAGTCVARCNLLFDVAASVPHPFPPVSTQSASSFSLRDVALSETTSGLRATPVFPGVAATPGVFDT